MMQGRIRKPRSRLAGLTDFFWPVLIIIVVLVVASVALLNYGSVPAGMREYNRHLEQGRFVEAGQFYAESIRGIPEREDEAQARVVMYLESLKEDYAEGRISAEEHIATLESMREAAVMGSDELIELSLSESLQLQESRQAWQEAEKSTEAGDLEAAIRSYSDVVLLDPRYQQAQSRLSGLRGRYFLQVSNEVEEAIDEGRYEEARHKLARADQLVPGQPAASRLEEEIRLAETEDALQRIIDESLSDMNAGRWMLAMNRIRQACELYPDESVLYEQREAYERMIVDRCLARADAAWERGSREEALAALDDGLDVLEDQPVLLTERAAMETRPVPEPEPVHTEGDEAGQETPAGTQP